MVILDTSIEEDNEIDHDKAELSPSYPERPNLA